MGVVLLRFLRGWFRVFFIKTFHWAIWVCVGGRKVADVFGIVIWCQKVEAGRRGRELCASCSAATWWRAVGLDGVCCGVTD